MVQRYLRIEKVIQSERKTIEFEVSGKYILRPLFRF